MYKYEYSFIANQVLSENEIASLIKNLCLMLTDNGATILKKECWGLLDLSYEIKKQKKGHYFMICVEAELALLNEFKRKLKLNELILRFMQIKIKDDSVLKHDSPMMEYLKGEGRDEKNTK